MCSLGGSLNLEFENAKIIAKRARVQEYLHQISVHVKSHNTIYVIVNLEGINDITSSGVIAQNTKPSLTNILYYVLKAKEKKNRKTKTPSPCQRNRILRALNLCQDTDNKHFSMDSGYDNHSYINPPYHQGPNQVDSSIDLQDEVISTKVVTRPTKTTRNVGPNKLILKKNRNKRKSHLENKTSGM